VSNLITLPTISNIGNFNIKISIIEDNNIRTQEIFQNIVITLESIDININKNILYPKDIVEILENVSEIKKIEIYDQNDTLLLSSGTLLIEDL
jgi:hypothetical protein